MTQNPLWRVQIVLRFPVCCYIQLAWEVFCSNCDPSFQKVLRLCTRILITPIFIKYVKSGILSTMLSAWTVDFNKSITFVNSKIDAFGSIRKF